MDMIEEIIILLGISLDVFGAMECQGALVAKIEKKQLAAFSSILAVGQAVFLGIGGYISQLLCKGRIQSQDSFLGQVAAATIFLCLGVRLFLKAWRNEQIVEHREERVNVLGLLKRYIRGSMFTLLTGIALGFLGKRLSVLLLLVAAFTVTATIVGLYTGYRLGYEHKLKAYILGGILLFAGGAAVITQYILC